MEPYTISYNAILFHADGRAPSIVPLLTTPGQPIHHTTNTSPPSRVPHPEIHMDVQVPANAGSNAGVRAWKYQNVKSLDGMNRQFAQPYVIFYPVVSRNERPLPINKAIKEIQEEANVFSEANAWRGNIVVAKYCDNPFNSMVNASMADFPLIKNHFWTRPAPKD